MKCVDERQIGWEGCMQDRAAGAGGPTRIKYPQTGARVLALQILAVKGGLLGGARRFAPETCRAKLQPAQSNASPPVQNK